MQFEIEYQDKQALISKNAKQQNNKHTLKKILTPFLISLCLLSGFYIYHEVKFHLNLKKQENIKTIETNKAQDIFNILNKKDFHNPSYAENALKYINNAPTHQRGSLFFVEFNPFLKNIYHPRTINSQDEIKNMAKNQEIIMNELISFFEENIKDDFKQYTTLTSSTDYLKKLKEMNPEYYASLNSPFINMNIFNKKQQIVNNYIDEIHKLNQENDNNYLIMFAISSNLKALQMLHSQNYQTFQKNFIDKETVKTFDDFYTNEKLINEVKNMNNKEFSEHVRNIIKKTVNREYN